jgi:hypothetical protein
MRISRRAAAVVVGCVAAAALTACVPVDECAGASCAPAARSLAVATDDGLRYDPRGDYAGSFGTLGGRAGATTACFWVDEHAPSPGTRVYLVLPAGYRAVEQRTGRLDLVDAAGGRVARAGDRVAVSVTPDPMPPAAGCPGGPALGALHVDLDATE